MHLNIFSKQSFHHLQGVVFSVLLIILGFPVVTHALPGDLNGSGRVDGYDLIIFSLANGSSEGDANWNPEADFDENGVIDQADLDILSIHFGNTGISFGLWVGEEIGTERLVKLSPNGNVLKRIGDVESPIAISCNVTDGSVWVADYTNAKVVKIASSGGILKLTTIYGMQSQAISVNSQDGSVWVADRYNGRVIKLLPTITDGYTVGTDTGSHIAVSGFSASLLSISVNPETGFVWVVSYNNPSARRIIRLSRDIPDGYNISEDTGKHISGGPLPRKVSASVADNSVWVLNSEDGKVIKLSADLRVIFSLEGFNWPQAIDTNYPDGSVCIGSRNGISRLSADGKVIFRAEGFDARAVAVNPLDGSCWGADYDNNQIVKLSFDGTELLRLSGFSRPLALSITPYEISETNQYPTASTELSDSLVDVGETITFTGTGTDPDGTIVHYEWDFDGDGTYDYSSPTTGITTHAYTTEGRYNPVFRVTDDDWLTATDYSQIVGVGMLKVTAGANVTSGTAPLGVNFSGSFLDPIDGSVDRFQWDFDGNKSIDYVSETSPDTSYTYQKAGTYAATLKVSDGPYTAFDSIDIQVSPSPPGIINSYVTPTSGEAPLTVLLYGKGIDPDGLIMFYEWDFDGDGTYDWFSTLNGNSQWPGNTTFIYTNPGSYTPRFRITDNDGLTATKDFLVEVAEPPPPPVSPVSPVAVANADSVEGWAPFTVNFQADESSDPDGNIVLYEWNFMGECSGYPCQLDWTSSADGTASYTYTDAGTYTATLRVTDDGGNTATDTVDIIVIPSTHPMVMADAAPLTGTAPLTVNFTGSGMDQDGNITQYHWNFGEEYVWIISGGQVIRLAQDGSSELVRQSGFNNPLSISVNPVDGSVWVANSSGNQVVKLAPNGVELVRVSGFNNPQSISVNPVDSSVWVADYNNNQVIKLASDGSELVRVSGFSYPMSVSVNASDNSVWVADSNNDQVVKLASDGTELVRVSGFDYPYAVSVNSSEDTVWVVDRYNNQVVKLASDGTELARVSGFSYPESVSVNSSDGSVWVADSGNYQVVKLASDGTELFRVSDFDYSSPLSVAVNPTDGTVWVATYEEEWDMWGMAVKLAPDGTELVRLDNLPSQAVAVADSGASNHYTSSQDGNTSHVYSKPGPYHAIFSVTDNDDNTSKKAIDIIVYGVPSVTADSNVSDGTVPLEVFFSATAADQDGNIVKYEWDFDGDGTYDYESTVSENARYVYDSAGTYAATVRVTDNDGYTATDSVTITVNLSPPMVTAGADLQEGNAPLTVNFTGSGSDADGTITLYEWDFDGDSTYDFSSATTGDTSYTYNTPGTYTASCRVTDNDGLWSTDSVTITVNPTGTPSASLSAAPTEGVIPLEVAFSANGSDPDGTITLYEIDFDGDGTYDTSSASPITDFPHTYSAPGDYAATLRVTDNDGKQAFASQNITVFAQENSAFIWVVDRDNHRIVKLSESGDMLAIISGFYKPWAIDVDSRDGSVWVAEDEQGSNRVVKLSADIADGYNIETDNGSHLIATGFSGPRSVSVNQSDGSVWVADRYNNQVVKLTSDGTELARVSGFFYPYSVSVNSSDGTVWVADAINDQVVKLASDGNELLRIGGFNEPYSVSVDSSDGSVWVAAGQSHLVAKLASDGTEMWRAGGFNYPSSVSANSSTGEGWVADKNHYQVVKIAPEGFEMARISGFSYPWELHVNPLDGTVWVADANVHDQVVKLAPDGTELLRIGGFNNPSSVIVDAAIRNLNQPPVATASVTPAEDGFSANFSGSATDNGTIVKYEWDFEGDGVYDYTSSTTGDTTHTYSSPGLYSPVFRVMDNDGMIDHDASIILLIMGDFAVSTSASPSTGDAPLSVTLDATVAAPKSQIQKYEWDFEGDWVFDWSNSSNPGVTHTYGTPGTYTAILRVTDNSGNYVYGSATVTVNEPPEPPLLPPSASNAASPTSGDVPLGVFLDGSGSDPDGSVVLYEWDYNGDGAYDWFSEFIPDTYFSYTTPGIYAATFRVTDNDGLMTTASRTITVTEKQVQPIAPTLDTETDIIEGAAPLTVNFSVIGNDQDGTIVLYEWDFDGDGTYDYSSAVTGNTSYTYTSSGLYNATLRVTDDDGLTAAESIWITVKDSAGVPKAVANANPTSGPVPLTVNFSAAGSSDPDGNIVLYEWMFGNEDIIWVTDKASRIYRVQERWIDKTLGSDVSGTNASSVAVNPTNGTAWASDYIRGQVVKIKADGSEELVRVSGFNEPIGISVNQTDGTVWVADHQNNQIVKLNPDGTEVVRVNGFYRPRSVAIVQSDGNVWVADTSNHQMVKLDSEGTELARISGFNSPWYVSVNQTDGAVWVADRGNNRIVKLVNDTPDGYDASPGQGSYHKALAGFNQPQCIAINPLDAGVWVCDTDNHQMVRVTEDLSREIVRVGGFNLPIGVCVTLDGTVWVADHNNNQVVVLSQNGEEIQRVGGFYPPISVAVYTPPESGYRSPESGDTNHTYSIGKYVATLKVTDNDGNWDTDSIIISSGLLKSLPMAHPTSGQAPLTVRFFVNGYSPSATFKSFIWDFNGDGVNDWENWYPANPSYTYVYPGTYTATQTVTNNRGMSDSQSITITVLPEDILTAQANAEPVEGTAPLTVNFLGLGSDANGFITKYEWDFDGDGTYDYESAATGQTSHTYTTLESYTAVLRVTDNENNTVTNSVRIEVKQPGAPVAQADASPTSGVTSLTVDFTGTATDDGSIVLYEWDFDGDGTYDFSSSSTGTTVHNYVTSGIFEAMLRVTDDTGLFDTDTVEIMVSPEIIATLHGDFFDPTAGESIQINSILSVDCNVTILIKDRSGNVVRTIVNDAPRNVGYYSDTWDGKDDSNQVVSDGVYLYIIEYEIAGKTYIYDITNEVDPNYYVPTRTWSYAVDPLHQEENYLRYTLDTKSEVTIWFSEFEDNTTGDIVRTLLFRELQSAGTHTVAWDGTDEAGNLVPCERTYILGIAAWRLPENAIIVNTAPVISNVFITPPYLNPDASPYDEDFQAKLSFDLSKNSDVRLSIYDSTNFLVRSFTIHDVPTGFGNIITWDGKNDNGIYVAPGAYRIMAIATDANGYNSKPVNTPFIIIFY